MSYEISAKSDDTNRVGSDMFSGNQFGEFELVDPVTTLAVLSLVGVLALFILKKAKLI